MTSNAGEEGRTEDGIGRGEDVEDLEESLESLKQEKAKANWRSHEQESSCWNWWKKRIYQADVRFEMGKRNWTAHKKGH